jgi:hypothetical protein
MPSEDLRRKSSLNLHESSTNQEEWNLLMPKLLPEALIIVLEGWPLVDSNVKDLVMFTKSL